MNGIGLSGTFFLFPAFGILGTIFALKRLPETRGVSLEQIKDNFKKL
jgi:major inositol transporter-like SP family MFS transporter